MHSIEFNIGLDKMRNENLTSRIASQTNAFDRARDAVTPRSESRLWTAYEQIVSHNVEHLREMYKTICDGTTVLSEMEKLKYNSTSKLSHHT